MGYRSRDDSDWDRFRAIGESSSFKGSEPILEKAPPWERCTKMHASIPIINPFTGELDSIEEGYTDNPDYDAALVARVDRAVILKGARAHRKVLDSGVFKPGSYQPEEVSVTIQVPTYSGESVNKTVIVGNPEIEAIRKWRWNQNQENSSLLDKIRKTMPKGELVREVELVVPSVLEDFSYLKKVKVKSKEFTDLTKSAENQLGKLIVKRREEAKKANKIVFEFPNTQVAHKDPATYYRPKFMKLFNTFSKGTYVPESVTEDYTLDTKGRWPKRDGHRVALIGSPKEHSKWGETLIVEDLEVGDRLRVNIKYILPPEEKILKWE